jgi:hypothetical protein
LNKYSMVAFFGIAVVFLTGLISVSCSPASGSASSNGPVVISSVLAEHTIVYPVGNTRIKCLAMAKDGSSLTYQWVSSDGTITGSGQEITWEAPKTYGDFHIMCTVSDGQGHQASQTATVTVIVRDPSKCCR